MTTSTKRRRRVVAPPAPTCQPTGDLRHYVDDRIKTCTLCAEIVTLRALADGSDWIVVDATGSSFARWPGLELCPCYPLDSPLRTRSGRIVNENRGPDMEIDEKSRHYGPGLNLPDISFHAHNDYGGEVYYTDLRSAAWACGHRPPPEVRTAWDHSRTATAPPPECCGSPMRYAPRGWNCRVDTRTWVVPT